MLDIERVQERRGTIITFLKMERYPSENEKLKMERQSSRPMELLMSQFPVHDPLPIWIYVVLFLMLSLLFFLGYSTLTAFPKPMLKVDELRYPLRFVSERAYDHVEYLANEIGYRVAGTENNEIKTVKYIVDQVRQIQGNASEDIQMTIDVEANDGMFLRQSKMYEVINLYRGAQNIVVKMSSKKVPESQEKNYILLNAHFDTVPMSPGAGDDGTMVGVMLELMRIMAKQEPTNHPLIFLFNGLEESGLQASHAFITNNKYVDKINVLVNLEVVGTGGKDLMFQTTREHSWLMNIYHHNVPHSFANTVAEEIYQNGLIPSDTDFTNFRKFAPQIAAYDFAHAYNCYAYHTKNDGMWTVNKGSLQHTGDNILALLKGLDSAPEVDDMRTKTDDDEIDKVVFFDFLGLFLIFYSQLTSTIINSILFVVLTLIVSWCVYQFKNSQGMKFSGGILEFIIAIAIQLAGLVLGTGVTMLLAFILDVCGRSMSWYANQWLILGLYFCPFFFCNCLIPYLYIRWREKSDVADSYYVQLAIHAHCTILSIGLAVLTGLKIRSSYILAVSTIFYFGTTLLNVLFDFVNKGNKWLYLHCLGQILPSIFYFYLGSIMYTSLIPINARAYNGAGTNPEYMVAGMTCGVALLGTGFYAPILNMFRHRKYLLGMFLGIFLITIILIMTPLGFPYREREAEARFTIWHTKREFYRPDGNIRKADSGYYVFTYDRHGSGPVMDEVPRMKDAVDIDDECNTEMLCGMPFYNIHYSGNAYYNKWVAAEEPLIPASPNRPYLKLVSGSSITRFKKEYTFAVAGTDHMSIQISPMQGARLVGWSFTKEMGKPSKTWNDRDVYFINYVHGLAENNMKEFQFKITVETDDDFILTHSFEIALAAHFVHQKETLTTQYKEFIASFPKWTNVQHWTSLYQSYQY
ncbi:endoplasmic reticulum metallopeptidase 1-like [Culicoides brevitarsis]|uniref:endoplasmic reticulum metallopeptidase 1-like n=1 Tax=Culicoides brevitarsis TaxID=469753 RepID=UPI00307BB53A